MESFSFERLNVWQDARKLATAIYKVTETFPVKERFGLIDQLNRAVVSISANIAEGAGRKSTKEQAHFYSIAYGSLLEVVSELYIAFDLEYISEEQFAALKEQLTVTAKQLSGLRRSLENK